MAVVVASGVGTASVTGFTLFSSAVILELRLRSLAHNPDTMKNSKTVVIANKSISRLYIMVYILKKVHESVIYTEFLRIFTYCAMS